MVNTKSAKKRIRQTKKRTLINDRYRDGIKKLKKQIRKVVEKKEPVKNIKELLKEFYSIVDKAAKRHVIHKNKAARLKSRITKSVEKVLTA